MYSECSAAMQGITQKRAWFFSDNLISMTEKYCRAPLKDHSVKEVKKLPLPCASCLWIIVAGSILEEKCISKWIRMLEMIHINDFFPIQLN